jgi:hypothetical protein
MLGNILTFVKLALFCQSRQRIFEATIFRSFQPVQWSDCQREINVSDFVSPE